MTDSYLTDEIMSLVGKKTNERHGLVTANDIHKFCAAIDEPNPLYTDASAARAAGYADVVAPPLFLATPTRPSPFRSGLLEDGQYDDAAPPGLGHLQTMLAGQSWELIRPVVAGERTIETFTNKSITERQGATGNIVFIDKESTITTLEGEVVERYVNTLILRQPPPPLPPVSGGGATGARASGKPVTEMTEDGFIKHPDMISLFMFSAAIWAVHRIHWDTPYAQSEGLPLPILPGWMLSSYLAQLAEMKAPAGQRLSRINVRYKGVVHPGDSLTCTAAITPAKPDFTLSILNQKGQEVAAADAAYAPA